MPRQTRRSSDSKSPPKKAVLVTEPLVLAELAPWELELLRPLFEAAATHGEGRHGH